MFTYNKKNESYDYETEKLKGVFQPGGAYSGIQSMVHKDEGTEWVGDFDSGYPSYDIPPGQRLYLMSFYHYLAKNLPFGILGRNMPGKVREDGGSLVLTLGHFGPCKTETEVRLRFTGDETLDVDIEITCEWRRDNVPPGRLKS